MKRTSRDMLIKVGLLITFVVIVCIGVLILNNRNTIYAENEYLSENKYEFVDLDNDNKLDGVNISFQDMYSDGVLFVKDTEQNNYYIAKKFQINDKVAQIDLKQFIENNATFYVAAGNLADVEDSSKWKLQSDNTHKYFYRNSLTPGELSTGDKIYVDDFTIIDNEKPDILSLNIDVKEKPEKIVKIKNGDVLKLKFLVKEQLGKIDDSSILLMINDKKVALTSTMITSTKSDNKEVYEYSINVEINKDIRLVDNDIINIALSLKDNSGNTSEVYTQQFEDIQYYAPIKECISVQSIESDSTADNIVTSGNIVNVTFFETHDIQMNTEKSYIMFGDEKIDNAEITCVQDSQNLSKYVYSFKVPDILLGSGKEVNVDNCEIKYVLALYDEVGNQDDISDVTGLIYYAPLEKSLKNISFDEDNKYIKTDDILTLNITTTHPVDLTSAFIANKAAVIEESSDKVNWVVKYKFTNSDSDINGITYKININDVVHSKYERTGKSNITFYESIKLKSLSMSAGKNYVKNGDKITLTFTTNHPVDINSSYIKMSQNINIKMEKRLAGCKYTAQYTIENDSDFDNQVIGFTITISDKAGNVLAVNENNRNEKNDKWITKSIRYYRPINDSITNLSVNSSNANPGLVRDGNKLSIQLKASHKISVKNASIAGRTVILSASNGGCTWSGTLVIKTGMIKDNSFVKYSLNICDTAGNTGTINSNKEKKIKFYAPIKLNDIRISSSNNCKSLAKNGDTVKVSFSTSHPVKLCKKTLSMSKNHDMEIEKNGFYRLGKYYYEMSYVVNADQEYDNNQFRFKMIVNDMADNDRVNINEEDTNKKVYYYSTIDSTIESVDFTTQNSSPQYVRNGENVTLLLKTKHPVNIKDAFIAGKKVTFNSKDGGKTWISTLKIHNEMLADNSKVEYEFKVEDKAGNAEYSCSNKDKSNITYYSPITINRLNVVSTNKNSDRIAKNGDNIQIDFQTEHPVIISSASMAGKQLTLNSQDGMNWSGCYTVESDDTLNMNAISFNIDIGDNAGNQHVSYSQNDCKNIIYYAPIQITDISIHSSNVKDGLKYAKNDDTATISFTSNHDISVSQSNVAGESVEAVSQKISDKEYRWSMNIKIRNGLIQDQNYISFGFIANDEAGNDNVEVTDASQGVQNRIQYFAPVNSETSFKSSYGDGTFVKNGDSVIVKSHCSHSVDIISAEIFGRSASVQGRQSTDLVMTYQIPINEAALPQKDVTFSYIAEDCAGNQINVNQISDSSIIKNIIYDRTSPVVKIVNDNTSGASYFAGKASYTIAYTGTNMYEEGASCNINGQECISNYVKTKIDNGYQITVTLEKDRNYVINASCINRAGNRDSSNLSVNITIDTTNPELSVTKVKTGEVFNKEINMADYLNINESNLKDVYCMMTDNTGTHDWDIHDKITGDGKKTVTLQLTDLAGNSSDTYTYEFYVDTTPPSEVVKDSKTGYVFKEGNNRTFKKQISLNVSLEDIFVNDKPDHFEKIFVLDDKGNKYLNLLESKYEKKDGTYSATLSKEGNYILQVQAVDSVGNSTDVKEYKLKIGQENVIEMVYKNTPLFIGIIIVTIVSLTGIAVWLVQKRKRNIISEEAGH